MSELDHDVAAARVYGFPGPNGASETTAIRMLLGLIAPAGGQARLLGRTLPDRRAVAQIGSMIEEPAFHPWPTNFWSRFVSGGQHLDPLAGLPGVLATAAVAAVIARWRSAMDVTA